MANIKRRRPQVGDRRGNYWLARHMNRPFEVQEWADYAAFRIQLYWNADQTFIVVHAGLSFILFADRFVRIETHTMHRHRFRQVPIESVFKYLGRNEIVFSMNGYEETVTLD